MQVSLDDFWQLFATSELFSPAAYEALRNSFSQLKGVSNRGSAQLAAQWLVGEGKLTRYQAEVLLAGRPGPFVFGPFTVVDRIAKGRLERVFVARYEGNQQVMFLPLVELTGDSREYDQFGELATLSAAVKSPHVTRTYRATRQRGQSLVVFETLSGQTLVEARAGKQFPISTACQLGVQLALGLVAIHEQRLLHGSISPQNVWVTPQGSLKLMQFPLVAPAARARSFEMPLADYVAPELLDREALPDFLTDIYSLGCVVYELLAGRPPFAGSGLREKLERQRTEIPHRLDQLNPKVPYDLAQIVDDMLQKDPVLRCQTASEAAHILGRFATSGRGAPPPPASKPAANKPPASMPPANAPPPGSSAPSTVRALDEQTQRAASSPPARKTPPAKPPSTPKPSTNTPPSAAPPSALKPLTERATGESTERAASIPTPPSIAASEPEAMSSPPAIAFNAIEDEEPLSDGGENDAAFAFNELDEPLVRSPRVKEPAPRRTWWWIGAAGAAVLILASGVLWSQSSSEQPAASTTDPSAAPSPTSETPASGEPTDAAAPPVETTTSNLVDDDGRTLWQSPTDGAPLELRYLPSGAQVIFAWRPAEMLASEEGAKIIAALGPAFAQASEQLQQTLGVPLTEVEQLVVAFAADDSLVPRASYVATLVGDVDQSALVKAWGDPAPSEHEGRQYFERDGLAWHLPTADSRTLVASTTAWMPEILELEGPPLLRSSLEQLLAVSDSQRGFTLLAIPGFAFNDGNSLLAGQLAPLLAPLRAFLGPDIEAISLSANLDPDLYVELRALAPVDRKPLAVLGELRARWEALPEQLESYIAALGPRPHAAPVLAQFPAMLREARNYTRSGVESRQLVMSAYLPGAAAHNLLLGAELALAEHVPQTTALAAAAAPVKIISATEALARKVTLSFPRETLEGALGIVAREIELPIIIQGNDLQLDGITRNQSLNDFDERGQPADDVLRKLLMLANPDGKLVYQVKTAPDGRSTIFVTTRAAVSRRGEQPAEGF